MVMSPSTIHQQCGMPMCLFCLYFYVPVLICPLVIVEFCYSQTGRSDGRRTKRLDLHWTDAIGWLLFRPLVGVCPTTMAENLAQCLPVYWGSAPWNFVWRLLLHFCGVCPVVLAIAAFFSSCIIDFRASDTSFSSMCFLGIIPDRRSLNIIVMYARMSSSSLKLLMGSTSIALLSISTITMMYLLPCCEHVGNCPVWLEKTVFLTSYTLMYMSRALCPWSVAVLGTSWGVRLGLVELTFFLDWFRWTFGVSLVSR